MLPSASALATQQLAEFLAVVSARPDSASATRTATERAARALDAEVAAVLSEGRVVTAVGYPAGQVPAADLAEVAAGRRPMLDIPGMGLCAAMAAPIGGTEPGHLVVSRSGDDGFSVDEISLVRGMARVLELTVETFRTLTAERRQAAENARLLASLQERQRLLEQLSAIQRAIARRAPLQQILDTITRGAHQLLHDEVAGLYLSDPDYPEMLLMMSHCGLQADVAKRMWRVPVADAGAAGDAVLRDQLVVLERHADRPHPEPEGAAGDLAAGDFGVFMAAPVHENGTVVGSLMVASRRSGRVYSRTDREVLLTFAEHVSLAVTDAKTLEAMYQAFHDSLTGMASRALFMDRLEHGLACAVREQTQLAVLFVDLDRFKMVNDSLGHTGGDMLLIEVADRLRSCLRAVDTAARFGGDEFAVLLHDIVQPEQPSVVANRIIETLRSPFAISGKEMYIDSSIGIAFSTPGCQDAEALIQKADLAMYQAKKNGKGRLETFEPGMQTRRMKNLSLEADLRRAVERDEFVLRYQPIVELRSGAIRGVEALVRWNHPQRGLIQPQDFVPLAEEAGLIFPVGGWVLYQACRQANRWTIGGESQPLTISVNLSARQLQRPDLPHTVARVLAETGLDPSRLVLEITESLLLHDTEATMHRLRQLKALGLRLALDDFGTGYSSLAYLRRFPVDILKIDKSFVNDIGHGTETSALTGAIVQLGRTLGLTTVAEGIETAEQLSELRASGCQLGQGYYFAIPLACEQVETMLIGPSTVPELPLPAPNQTPEAPLPPRPPDNGGRTAPASA